MTQTSTQPAASSARRPASLQSPILQTLERHLQTRAFPEASVVVPGDFTSDVGHSYTFDVPFEWVSDASGVSSLRLLEDGRHLGPVGAGHDDIRQQGGGRFSHWSSTVFFSTSDNSDPRTNGRVYTVVPPADCSLPTGDSPWASAKVLCSPTSRESVPVTWSVEPFSRETIRPMGGCLYAVSPRGRLPSDSESFSTVLLLEDGRLLARSHLTSHEIIDLGKDAYGHWGEDVLFASSDGSDPRTNGRSYCVASARAFRFDHARLKPEAEEGHCWVLESLPAEWSSDKDGPSRLRLLEDGKPLGPGHALHDQVRETGQGTFCHWGTTLFFSTSDGSSPLTNGRTYTVVMQESDDSC